MIIITGANGPLGRAVVERLLAHPPADRIVACVRDPAQASALVERGVTVRAGDFRRPDTLAAAFEGATQVLVVSVNELGETAIQLHRAAIEAARAAGAQRVLYTSHMGARLDSPFAPADNHATTESILAESGQPFVALRHGFYAESAFHLVGHGLEAGEIRVPEDGPVSWTARADLAEADALAVADEGRLNGITPPLTALEVFTMADLARIASEVTGRTIRRVVLSDDEWRETAVAQGMPLGVANLLLGFYQAARRGDFAAVDPTLGHLLGRPPQTLRDVLRARLVAT